jgi:hypothetical protein
MPILTADAPERNRGALSAAQRAADQAALTVDAAPGQRQLRMLVRLVKLAEWQQTAIL